MANSTTIDAPAREPNLAQTAVAVAALLVLQAVLLYAMGRDGVLPRPILGYLQPRFRTPVLGIILIGIVGLAALFLDVTTSTSFNWCGCRMARG